VLGGLQVYVGGKLAPMLFAGEVSATQVQVNFQIPSSVPSSDTVDIQVVDQATQEVLGAGFMAMQTSDPGIFATNSQGTGQISAVFQRNGTYYCNGPTAPPSAGCPGGTSPVKPDEVLEIYLTGAGFQSDSNWPKDGEASPNAVSTSGSKPMVWIGTGIAHDYAAEVQYSGVAPNYVGLWQINVKVPNTYIDPDSTHTNPIILKYRDIFSQPKTTIVIQEK
jgi:uncharacterized protein (TIGR03437 family)